MVARGLIAAFGQPPQDFYALLDLEENERAEHDHEEAEAAHAQFAREAEQTPECVQRRKGLGLLLGVRCVFRS